MGTKLLRKSSQDLSIFKMGRERKGKEQNKTEQKCFAFLSLGDYE